VPATVKNEIVRGYLKLYPDTPSLTLSKLIYKKEPSAFSNIENVRQIIRYLRGQRGSALKKNIASEEFFKDTGRTNPFESMPEGIRHFDEWLPINLTESKTLIIGDIHAPYHSKEALTVALEYGYKQGVDGILILGDFVDFYASSRWETDPRKRDLWGEIQAARSILESIRAGFSGIKIRVKQGNHDERYERWLWVKAPELLEVPDFNYENFLHFKKHDIELIQERRIIKIDSLNLIHGHEFGRMFSDPVNPARGVYNRGKAHCMCAHWHRTSGHSETDMDGKTIGTWSIGCACDLHPDYAPINKWNHGFGMVENLQEDGFLVHNFKIIKGKAYNG